MKREVLGQVVYFIKRNRSKTGFKKLILFGIIGIGGLFIGLAAVLSALAIWLWPGPETRQAWVNGLSSLPQVEAQMPEQLEACRQALTSGGESSPLCAASLEAAKQTSKLWLAEVLGPAGPYAELVWDWVRVAFKSSVTEGGASEAPQPTGS